jgi:transcriptional regulator with XRE-family HTH domain
MGDARTFGRWLDLTMTNRSITGRSLAKKLKVTDSAVSRWRSGTTVPGMDTCIRMAQVLGVDPLRLAVTAGLMDGTAIRVEELPMPEPTAQRSYVKEQILRIKGLTQVERQLLLDTYDDMSNGEAAQ